MSCKIKENNIFRVENIFFKIKLDQHLNDFT